MMLYTGTLTTKKNMDKVKNFLLTSKREIHKSLIILIIAHSSKHEHSDTFSQYNGAYHAKKKDFHKVIHRFSG
jgi:hypothetical protein